MKIYIILLFMISMISISVYAESKVEPEQKGVNFVPLLQYDNLSLEEQSIESYTGGLMINSEDVLFVGLYTQHSFSEDLLYDYPEVYHTIDTLLDGKNGRHRYLGIFKSESDKPLSVELSTQKTAGVYGYEFIQGQNLSLVLGGGIAIGDFGIERSENRPWPVIIVPFLRMIYSSEFIDAKFEFLTSPNFSFTIAPKSRLRLTWDSRIDQARDMRDLIFELALVYRFFPPEHEMGDFAGISLGIKNDNYGAFTLADTHGDEAVEVHYYSAFGSIDLSLLKITGGYAFNGRELYREDKTEDLGEGYFLSVQALYQF